MSTAELRVTRDPALALVVRIFVGAVAERWSVSQAARDDLRLVASELFAGAVEDGAGDDVTFTVTSEGDRVSLSASGVDGLTAGDDPDETWGGRLGLIRALFPTAEVGDSVSISVETEGSPTP